MMVTTKGLESPAADGESDHLDRGVGAAGPSRLNAAPVSQHATLKYSLLGPSLTKAGQDSVDQAKVTNNSSKAVGLS